MAPAGAWAPHAPMCTSPSLASTVLCLILLLLIPNSASVEPLKAAALSREIRQHFRLSGFNWVSPKMLAQVVDLKTNTKPIMYLFTMNSCSSCRDLMQEFQHWDHTRLSQLSAQFHAVLALDDYALEYGPEFSPEGFNEVPRIIFADPDGKLRPEFRNPKSDNATAWFYSSVQEVVDRMRTVLEYYQKLPLSLARPGLRAPGSERSTPASSIEGGFARQYAAGLQMDMPS